jgi:TetR/AcrR family transcriptional repressor of nem operon
MKRSREEAAETRSNIVKTAAKEFRKNGIDHTALSDLMAAAGLTHGGFYRHFDSKDQLVAEACSLAMESEIDTLASVKSKRSSRSSLRAVLAHYLSTTHRDTPSSGCPLAALGSELARCDNEVRAIGTDGFERLVGIIEEQLPLTGAAARRRAVASVCAMIGAITMSRVVNNKQLSTSILEQTARYLHDS